MFNATLRLLYPRQCPCTLQGAGSDVEPVWTGAEKLAPNLNSIPGPSQPAASRCIGWAILSSRSVQSQSWPCELHTRLRGRWIKLQATTTLPSENVPLGIHWIGVYLDPPLSIGTLRKWQKCLVLSEMGPWFLGFGGGAQSLHRHLIPSPSGNVYHRTVLFIQRDVYGRHHCTAVYLCLPQNCIVPSETFTAGTTALRCTCVYHKTVLYPARRLRQAPLHCSVPSRRSRLDYRDDSRTVVVGFPTEARESSPNLTFRGPCIVIYSCNKTNEMH